MRKTLKFDVKEACKEIHDELDATSYPTALRLCSVLREIAPLIERFGRLVTVVEPDDGGDGGQL